MNLTKKEVLDAVSRGVERMLERWREDLFACVEIAVVEALINISMDDGDLRNKFFEAMQCISREKMKNKKTLEDKINDFLNDMTGEGVSSLIRDVMPLIRLYNVDEYEDWVRDEEGEEDYLNVRLIRTVYLMSIIASNHAGSLCKLNMTYPKLWQKIEEKSEKLNLEMKDE